MFAEDSFDVFVLKKGGENECFFIGNQVARMLGYADPNGAVQKHCPDRMPFSKLRICPAKLAGLYIRLNTNMISEGDILNLIWNSQLPKSKDFKRTVISIIKCVGKYGCYPPPEKQAIGYQRQPHELEYADCVREGNEGTSESKLGRIKEKMTECQPLKNVQKQEWGKLGGPVAKRNRQLLKDKVLKLTQENMELLELQQDYEEHLKRLNQELYKKSLAVIKLSIENKKLRDKE